MNYFFERKAAYRFCGKGWYQLEKYLKQRIAKSTAKSNAADAMAMGKHKTRAIFCLVSNGGRPSGSPPSASGEGALVTIRIAPLERKLRHAWSTTHGKIKTLKHEYIMVP